MVETDGSVQKLVDISIARSKLLGEKIQSVDSSVQNIHQTIAGRRRFYKYTDIKKEDGGYHILFDGRKLKTPARNALSLPSMELALAVAAEWDAQTDTRKGIEPITMPLMTLVSTCIDQIQPNPNIIIRNCMKYLPTDSALFFTSESDRLLLSKQKQYYSPIIRWANKNFQIKLEVTDGMVSRIEHSDETIQKIASFLENMDSYSLAALQSVTYECKSLLIALAYISRYISLDQVIAASRLEEEFQLEIWGVVEGGHDMDRLNNAVNLSSAGLMMSLLYDEETMKSKIINWRAN